MLQMDTCKKWNNERKIVFMKKRWTHLLACMLALLMFLTACGGEAVSGTPADGSNGNADPLKILVLIPGTRGDMSVNDLAARGLEKYAADSGCELKVFETGDLAGDFAKYESVYRDAFEEDWDLIFTNSKSTRDILYKILPEYPDVRLIAYDDELDFEQNDLPNAISVTYKQNECSFLAGALAAKLSETGILGVVSALESPVIHDFMYGFVQGALYADPDIKVLNSTVGSATDALKAKELAIAQIKQGADVLYPPAANGVIGVLEAGASEGVYVIGVDSDRAASMKESNPEIAEIIPTSAVKNVSDSLYRLAAEYEAGTLEFGQHLNLGIKEEGVGLVDNEFYQSMVPEDIRAFIDETAEKIASGEIEAETALYMTAEEVEEIREAVRP